jgi:hypothetical protein
MILASFCKEGVRMAIQWKKDVDEALKEAKQAGKFLLLDFNATPM